MIYALVIVLFFFFKQKTAYEMRISDWSSDVCSSDLLGDSARHPAAKLLGEAVDGIGGEAAAAVNGNPVSGRSQQGGERKFEQTGLQEIGRASCRERVCQYV